MTLTETNAVLLQKNTSPYRTDLKLVLTSEEVVGSGVARGLFFLRMWGPSGW
jgi:hypothetical protein